MKARVKATDRVIQVMNVMDEKGNSVWEEISDMTNHCPKYSCDELEFIDIPIDVQKRKIIEPDYWEKLKHQYAGMAMQGILSNNNLLNFLCEGNKKPLSKIVLDNADIIATALVNRLKKESQCEK